MNIQSLGYSTHLMFPRFKGETIDRGDYIVVREPDNPTHHWGNFLLFSTPPVKNSLEKWSGLFTEEFGCFPNITHIALGWDSPNGEMGEIEPFVNAGFNVDHSVVLTAAKVHPASKHNIEIEIRRLVHDWEWHEMIESQVAGREQIYTEAGYREYKTPAAKRHRAMTQARIGQWFGAFMDGKLVGDLGVFVDAETKLGRFQSVGTHPDYRRRGICGRLVYDAAKYALEKLGAETLVMVADSEYHAARIYESVGFRITGRETGICKW